MVVDMVSRERKWMSDETSGDIEGGAGIKIVERGNGQTKTEGQIPHSTNGLCSPMPATTCLWNA